jgi:hypothetical protein
LANGKWHTLALTWNEQGDCAVALDGKLVLSQRRRAPLKNGVSYLRLRSLAVDGDKAGFYVDKVHVKVN